jgi:hypothetical protein
MPVERTVSSFDFILVTHDGATQSLGKVATKTRSPDLVDESSELLRERAYRGCWGLTDQAVGAESSMKGRIWRGKFVVIGLPVRSNGPNLPTKSRLRVKRFCHSGAGDITRRALHVTS